VERMTGKKKRKGKKRKAMGWGYREQLDYIVEV